MRNKFNLILSCLVISGLFVSCSKRQYSDDVLFKSKVYLKFAQTFKVEIFNHKYVNSGNKIDRPVNTWQNLLRLDYFNENNEIKAGCLVYKIPYLKGEYNYMGHIRLYEINITLSCDNLEKGELITEIEDINSLRVYLSSSEKIQSKDKMELDPFNLMLLIKKRDELEELEEKKIIFPLLNLSNKNIIYNNNSKVRKGSIIINKYSSSSKMHYIPGTTIRFASSNKSKLNKRQMFKGKLTDSYLDKTAIICQSPKKEFDCDKCKYGWYQGISKDGIIRFCGEDLCGERGMPACPRGLTIIKNNGYECIENSKLGFCKDGLRTYCDENKVLVCL